MADPRVSVVVTHYNQNDLLGRALESIALQTLQPLETILVDDGSDRIPDLSECKTLDPSQITQVFTPHRGTAAALNTAVSIMCGDIFCWLPSDDYWRPNKLEAQLQFSRSNSGCILHSYVHVLEGSSVTEGMPPDLDDDEFSRVIHTTSPYFATTFWIPKSILDTVGPFREDIPASEDYEWVLRSVVKHHVKYRLQKEFLAIKRIHGNRTTTRCSHLVPGLIKQFNEEQS